MDLLVLGHVTRDEIGGEVRLGGAASYAAIQGVPLADTLAVGDGANDIPMLEEAGLGIAYHAKPAAAEAADARVDANDLTAILFAQGYARKDWVED